MSDIILEKFFELPRWEYAIEKGVGKHIPKRDLYQLTKPEVRLEMYEAIRDGRYQIAPPHTAQIPKDNGDFRTVYINEPIDRVLLSIANDLLFELMPEMVHPKCRSYQKGMGCGKIVKEISKEICKANDEVIGWKSDLSKYFDSVPLCFIEQAFHKVENKYGHSALIDVLRKYYNSDWYFSPDGELHEAYQSLKQGCAVASWLADVLLYHIDSRIDELNGEYIRYSDDMLFVGPDYEEAMFILRAELEQMNMSLNPKKVEYLTPTHWFKFLGYSIKGSDISLSSTRLKTFQKEILSRTIRKPDITLRKAVNAVNRYLYKGDGEFSWATQILPICNVKSDIHELDKFVMDCLRAVMTGKTKIGGLGYVASKSGGCIQRGLGRNVKANREKTPQEIEGYLTISCMQNAMVTNREAYLTLVESL
jgi:hypothetical protein